MSARDAHFKYVKFTITYLKKDVAVNLVKADFRNQKSSSD